MAYATDNRGGGQALPPYLQGRKMTPTGPFQTAPMITPPSSVVPGEVKQKQPGVAGTLGAIAQPPAQPAITPAAGQPAQPGNATPGPQTLYDFLKHDLEDKRKTAMSNADADASARGVYYGTPLTTSHGDIQTEFLRGLGTLQANMLQNEAGNENTRLGLASNLLNQAPQSGAGGVDPNILQQLGALFGSGNAPVAGQRTGPVITPARGNQTQSQGR